MRKMNAAELQQWLAHKSRKSANKAKYNRKRDKAIRNKKGWNN